MRGHFFRIEKWSKHHFIPSTSFYATSSDTSRTRVVNDKRLVRGEGHKGPTTNAPRKPHQAPVERTP